MHSNIFQISTLFLPWFPFCILFWTYYSFEDHHPSFQDHFFSLLFSKAFYISFETFRALDFTMVVEICYNCNLLYTRIHKSYSVMIRKITSRSYFPIKDPNHSELTSAINLCSFKILYFECRFLEILTLDA